MSTSSAQRYYVIPLSVQSEEDAYLVGNVDMGDFYQIPEPGLVILNMLRSGDTASTIKSRLAANDGEVIDVDEFIDQLTGIGFIHPEDQREKVQEQLLAATRDTRRTFNVDPRVAKAIFSAPASLFYLSIVLYAAIGAIRNPELRINFNAFYIETNRTALLLLVLGFSIAQVAMHESGHMLAAARHGIRSKYGIGNRLWTIVAESDLTGILTLPKAQRYFPMLAGPLVDVLCIALLTILIQVMLQHGAHAFAIQLVQAFILEIVIGIIWQFNIFVKTDIYFVLCNYFGQPDLDRDARGYLRNFIYRATLRRFGSKAPAGSFKNLPVIRTFSAIWLGGRLMSLFVLFCVFLPTMARYIESVLQLLSGPPASAWKACDTIIYVSITLSMLGAGMHMWLKQR